MPRDLLATRPPRDLLAAPEKAPYKGSILPFSHDGEDWHFDSDAGLLGDLKRAYTLPGDVYEGRVDPRSDEAIERTFDLATTVSPASMGRTVARNVANKRAVKLANEVIGSDGTTPRDLLATLNAKGQNHMAVDVGPNARIWAGGIANRTGPSKAVVEKALKDRASGASGRMQSLVNREMGNADDAVFLPEQIKARQQELSKPLYDDLENMVVKGNQQLDEVLNRPDGALALNEGKRIAANQGREFNRDALTVRDLDYAKRHLDDEINSAFERGKTAKGTGLKSVRDDLLAAIDPMYPQYPKAREVFAGEAALDSAFTKGGQLFDARQHPLELKRSIGDMTAGEKQMHQAGARRALAMKMGNARSDVNKLRAELDKDFNREKLSAAFGKDPANRVLRSVDDETTFMHSKNDILANSQTAVRQDVQKRMNNPELQGFEAPTMAAYAKRALVYAFQNVTGRAVREKELNKLAKVLTETGADRKELNQLVQDIAVLYEGKGRLGVQLPKPYANLIRALILEQTNED